MSKAKKIIKNIIPQSIINLIVLIIWKRKGKPIPPPHYLKQLVIKEYKKNFNIDVFVETGTYLGDMIYAMKKKFKKIYSIELGNKLWGQAVRRFKNYNNIEILQGDSGQLLFSVIKKINEKAIFWLDGHYSGGITVGADKACPIFNELTAIFSSNINHILLIDDARCFNGLGGYPTIQKLSEFIISEKGQSKIKIKDDIVRVILE